MLIRTLTTAAALTALTACNQGGETAAANEAAANAVAAAEAANVIADMPPPIKAQQVYRCKDASLVYVDFFDGDQQASLRDGEKTATATTLKAEAAGDPFVAEGYSVSGQGDAITIERPGKGSQACKA